MYRSNPASESLKNGLANSYSKLGGIYEAQGQLAEALKYYQNYNHLKDELYRSNPASESLKNGLAVSYSKLGGIYQAQWNLDDALKYYQDYNQLREELCRSNPQSYMLADGLAISYYKLGKVYVEMENLPEARGFLAKARDIFGQLYDQVRIPDLKRKLETVEKVLQSLPQ
ncbi:MAG: tetratricopeptide repeat protein [Bacteroidia bacterium]|nr:tetratricopeptide repeat protein [Bacteroidia bacterium]